MSEVQRRTALVISPHADDAAAYCGGTLIKWAQAGWRIVFVRITDDARDSVGLSVAETLRRNAQELHEAAALLGAEEVVDLGFPTDTLADVPLGQLRERIVYLFRKYRPYAVFGFDPDARYEPNQDHVRVAQATEEAYWVATFDLHHPEHFAEGFAPFAVCEHWYFARTPVALNGIEDITEQFDQKIRALAAHRTMMQNIIHALRLQVHTYGMQSPLLDAAQEGDPAPLLDISLRAAAAEVAAHAGLAEGRLAEGFRVTRFGDAEPLLREIAAPRPGALAPVARAFLGDADG